MYDQENEKTPSGTQHLDTHLTSQYNSVEMTSHYLLLELNG